MATEQWRRRLRPVRRDAGQMRWTERDLAVLPWIAEQYAVRLDQLHTLLGRQLLDTTREDRQATATTVRHCLERWRRAGVVQYSAFIVGEPGWVWLTREGQCQAGLEYPCWMLERSRLDHLFASTQARLWVEAREPGTWWRSERAMCAEQPWVPAGERLGQCPSAEGVSEAQTVAVEVLPSWRQPLRVRTVLHHLLTIYPSGCWYFVAPCAQPGLARLLAELEPAQRRRVRLIALAELGRSAFPGRRASQRSHHSSYRASVGGEESLKPPLLLPIPVPRRVP